jgi:hypothetical protein
VVSGAATVNPEQAGTKCAFRYTLTVRPGESAVVRIRLRPKPDSAAPLPHRGFSRANFSTSPRASAGTGGRPEALRYVHFS